MRWLALASVLLILGCTSLPPAPPPDSAAAYRLDSGDKVRVIVYNQESLSQEYAIGDDGTLSFPMLGTIKARGETLEQLRKEIYAGLNNGIFNNPGVSVEVSQYRPFYVLGEVSKPGEYPYASGLNVLAALAIAGGLTVRGDEGHMTVVRTHDGHGQQWHAEPLTTVQPGDVVVVPERFF